jgi:hypothetical protein
LTVLNSHLNDYVYNVRYVGTAKPLPGMYRYKLKSSSCVVFIPDSVEERGEPALVALHMAVQEN